MNFGYRVFDEVAVFVSLGEANGLFGDNEAAARRAFDVAVLMKVLPKFYGSLARLRAPLRALLNWCDDPTATAVDREHLEGDETGHEQGAPAPALPTTHARAKRMLDDAVRTGFASYG